MRSCKTMRGVVVAVVLLLATCMWAQSGVPSLDDIVTRMEAAEAQSHAHATAYTVTRQYTLSDQDPSTPDSRVLAKVSFVPPSAKDFTLYQEEGSDRAAKIVRKVLDHETQMSGHYENVAIARQNYQFALASPDSEIIQGHRCYVVQIIPRRETADLMRGRAWVDADNYMIRQIQGEPAKNPSWWIKDLQVTLNYDDVHGLWLQRETSAVAVLRFFGTHTLSSRAVSIETPSAIVAQNRPPRAAKRMQRAAVSDSAVWVPR